MDPLPIWPSNSNEMEFDAMQHGQLNPSRWNRPKSLEQYDPRLFPHISELIPCIIPSRFLPIKPPVTLCLHATTEQTARAKFLRRHVRFTHPDQVLQQRNSLSPFVVRLHGSVLLLAVITWPGKDQLLMVYPSSELCNLY